MPSPAPTPHDDRRGCSPRPPVATALCIAAASLATLLTTPVSTSARDAARSLACRPVTEAVDALRSRGLRIAYSENLLSPAYLVRGNLEGWPPPERLTPAEGQHLLRRLVEPYALDVAALEDGTLTVVPGPELDAAALRRLRRDAGPLLRREDDFTALPEWLGRNEIESEVLTVDYPDVRRAADVELEGEGAWSHVIVRLGDLSIFGAEPLGDLAVRRRIAFELKNLVVDLGARLGRSRFALEAEPATLEALVDAELAPYVDGYLTPGSDASASPLFVPAIDDSGRPWLRTTIAAGPRGSGDSLLDVLLEGSRRGAALVLVADADPDPKETAFLDALGNLEAGLLDGQPSLIAPDGVSAKFFLDPQTNRYLVAITAHEGTSERLWFQLEPIAEARVAFPTGAEVASDFEGRSIALQLDGSARHWIVELEPGSRIARSGRVMVEDDVIVDPYEVVVQNQIFQQREDDRRLSLDVMEYATITPMWRDGRRSRWEHRILSRRGWHDEYHHLNLWRDGVQVPHDKLYKGVLGRPIDRIEMEPLTVENRKTYRYTYEGRGEVDGRPAWKIGFEPVTEGRLVSGTVWIDQQTGAHLRIRTAHRNLGVGVLSGEYTTDFEWVPDASGSGDCYWDWRLRRGTETVDYLDFTGSYTIDYERSEFYFNRADIERQVEQAHASDILIHVATPPDGHRWLLRGDDLKPGRGDLPYGPLDGTDAVGLLRERDDCDVPGRCGEVTVASRIEPTLQQQETSSAADTSPLGSELGDLAVPTAGGDAVLAGLHAFPSNSRISFGASGGTGAAESDTFWGFNYVNFDFLGRGKRGKGELYFWIGGFDDDGLISLTDPSFFGSRWSSTTSFDVRFNPEEDFLFQDVEPQAPGDESSFRNLSLDTERTSIRFSLSRPLTGQLGLRLRYELHDLVFERRPGTDPAFVLPRDTTEHQVGFDLTWTRRHFTTELRWMHGERDEFRDWGIDASQPGETSFDVASLRVSTSHSFGRSQTVGASLALITAANDDRFSRPRLFQVGARVPGYSGGIGFDRGTHAAASYNFRIWRLPLRIRLDAVNIDTEALPGDPTSQFEQRLLGGQLNLDLHGPFETDWHFGVGRGLGAEPSRGVEETYYWVVVSRRFGGG